MASMLSLDLPLATGIGALPHHDPDRACREVLAIYPEFPYAPSLPDRNILESIVYNDSEQLPGRLVTGEKLLVDSTRDLSTAMEQIYLDFMEKNHAPYGASPGYASGFHAMVKSPLPGICGLKCQVTGPVTFGMQVVDRDKRPIYYDPQFADVLGKLLGLRARWCETTMKERTLAPQTLVVLNEPYFASLGSSVVPVDNDMVRSNWSDIASIVDGGLGVHCCSNTDWGFVMDLDPAVISLDAYATAAEFLLYSGKIAEYLERGGVIAWGIVPAEYRIFSTETVDSLFTRFMDIRSRLLEYVPEKLFDSRCLVTPSCGIRFADEKGAREIMGASAEIARRLRSGAGAGS